MTRNKKILLIAAILIVVLVSWCRTAVCYQSAPMRPVGAPEGHVCGCIGKNVILDDGWAYDGNRKFLCLGIPK